MPWRYVDCFIIPLPLETTLLIIFLSASLILALFLFVRYSRLNSKIKDLQVSNELLQKQTAGLEILGAEKTLLSDEKKKLDEKNKKLWSMSEAVYKEKGKVEEENQQLTVEKEKLAGEKKKVDEKVKKLWSQSMAIHKEKEKINEMKLEIEHKHKEVMDSVNYAKRIQEAILPDRREILKYLPDSFILFKPRDIVSGDFYWFTQAGGKNIIAAVDCTGHGVPGAFMSMIGNTLLNQIVNEQEITEPAHILTQLNEKVNTSLKQNQLDSESRDGMDIAICAFNVEKAELEYAGANRPLYIVSNGVLKEIKANKFPIGGLDYDIPKVFTNHTVTLERADAVYISSDGYADQFNPEDSKLMTRKFKELLVSVAEKPMEEQGRFLGDFIDNWKGSVEQTDDVLVIGVKI
jgi:serine phosphatase RsbU (regulator of sigma subunit)